MRLVTGQGITWLREKFLWLNSSGQTRVELPGDNPNVENYSGEKKRSRLSFPHQARHAAHGHLVHHLHHAFHLFKLLEEGVEFGDVFP